MVVSLDKVLAVLGSLLALHEPRVRESKETSEALRRHAHGLQLHILAQTTAFATQKHALEQALAAKEQQAGRPPQHSIWLLY
jgi:predicted component of type VI protein secretion system